MVGIPFFAVKVLFFVLSTTSLLMGSKWWWGFGPSLDRFVWKDPLHGFFLTRLFSVLVSFVFNYVSCESPWRVYLNGFDWDGSVGFWLLFLFVIDLSFFFKLFRCFSGFVLSNVRGANFEYWGQFCFGQPGALFFDWVPRLREDVLNLVLSDVVSCCLVWSW